ncbi:Long chain base biosynthesis protein 1a [Zea mays]|uniref:serine C-palmitoyltransferase n=1 Tax=Zea mays TaxID=4577 RepID=A0A3L6EW05_MAIZE|nr:Long chain base biosynthesis protein 1a [Zea mays]
MAPGRRRPCFPWQHFLLPGGILHQFIGEIGVGSCGPRGFYGTIDVHLDCESKIAKFLGTPDSILYSYGISTIFSVIPAFYKKGDIIVTDEGVHWAVQNGLHLSRSIVVYFKHNDMASLASTLEKLTRGNKRAEKIRRYIVVESIYQAQCF